MKVEELFEEKLSDYSLRLIQRLGIRKLGSGAYAHVFQHPTYSNIVVKVFVDKDKVYKRYITWCRDHQDNPYVPKIESIEAYESPSGDKYNFVFMEKMKPISKSLFRSWLRKTFGDEAVEAESEEDYFTLRKIMNAKAKKSMDQNFREVMLHITSYALAQFDIHQGNIMMRDGHLVFTDPVGKDPGEGRVDS